VVVVVVDNMLAEVVLEVIEHQRKQCQQEQKLQLQLEMEVLPQHILMPMILEQTETTVQYQVLV
jgi:hypothetical protein|tara:strand:+ start:78 stop:269 length:192 start_codon:yes stop_codon:yes gene_type:complete